MIIGKRDVREVTRLKWDHLRLTLQQGLMERDTERLLQYGALLALAKVQHDDFQLIIGQARGDLSRPCYDALLKFAAHLK